MTRPAFLSPAELVQLTGYKLAAKQIQWLTRNGVPHHVNALGKPVVAHDALHAPPPQRYALGGVR